jgi:hypothetical protein
MCLCVGCFGEVLVALEKCWLLGSAGLLEVLICFGGVLIAMEKCWCFGGVEVALEKRWLFW